MENLNAAIDQEVRIRLLEEIIKKVDKRFDKLENKIDTQFYWVLGTFITLFGGVTLHLANFI